MEYVCHSRDQATRSQSCTLHFLVSLYLPNVEIYKQSSASSWHLHNKASTSCTLTFYIAHAMWLWPFNIFFYKNFRHHFQTPTTTSKWISYYRLMFKISVISWTGRQRQYPFCIGFRNILRTIYLLFIRLRKIERNSRENKIKWIFY